MKFIIGKTKEDKEMLTKHGFSFFKEENDEFWFLFDGTVTFSNSSFEIRDRVNV